MSHGKADPQGGTWLELPAAYWPAERTSELSAWTAHTPFAMWLVMAMRPAMIVELGTHAGVSFAAFCQAVAALDLPTRCAAVDTWRGDEHTAGSAASYASDVYSELHAWLAARYGQFSGLVRSTFDDARPRFLDGTVDILHIDGFHTYDAVRHDFETWQSALSASGVVLFHDTAVRTGTFGVWRLWEELVGRYPSFSFEHGHGLGVLCVGCSPTPALAWLTGLRERGEIERVRTHFAGLGRLAQVHSDLIAERAAMLGSISWRVTAPLRRTARWLRLVPRRFYSAGSTRGL